MIIGTSALGRIAALIFCAALYLASVDSPQALAHGGRIKPPPPMRGPPPAPQPRPTPPKPTDPKPTPGSKPPPFTPPPLTPGGQGPSPSPTLPTPGSTPTTQPLPPPGTQTGGGLNGGKGGGFTRRKRAFLSPELNWQQWWALNRWAYLPARGARWIRADAVVTPSGDTTGDAVDPARLAARQRTIVTRQHVLPFLLRQLDPARAARPEVRAAALIALAKLTNDPGTVSLLFRYAEADQRSDLVRESAALAVGMLRRDDPDRLMQGVHLDAARERLLALVDDAKAAERTRAYAALSLGMLGNQPFGTPFSKDGRVVARALWQRLQRKHANRELPVALLTALGMQPAAGTSEEIRQSLFRVSSGRRIARRSWDATERSHALTALVRQEGRGWSATLFRAIGDKRLPAAVRRGAFIAMGAKSAALDQGERLDAIETTLRGVRLARDPMTRGLGTVAVGRLLGADLRGGSLNAFERSGAADYLLAEARHGSLPERGYAVIALALSLRNGTAKSIDATRFKVNAVEILLRGLERTKNPSLRGAYAVALGLLGPGITRAEAPLTTLLADRKTDPAVRGHAALALAQMGAKTGGVRKALRTALLEKRSVELRSQAALALSFLSGEADTKMLVRELRNTKSQWVLAQVAAALGHLGDLSAVTAVLEVAGDARRPDETRALAIASLGLLVDPASKPSMLHLTIDSNYPARTDALLNAFSIL